MSWVRCACAVLVAVVLAACDQKSPAPTSPPATSAHWEPTHVLPKLPTVKLWIGARELDAELCVTPEQVVTGLMFRAGIAEDELMLFIFRSPGRASFYMKNVDFDIDVAYLKSEGVISEIVRLKKRDETGVRARTEDIQFVLEAAPGWFARNGFGVGTVIRTPKGSLRDVLGPRAQVERPDF